MEEKSDGTSYMTFDLFPQKVYYKTNIVVREARYIICYYTHLLLPFNTLSIKIYLFSCIVGSPKRKFLVRKRTLFIEMWNIYVMAKMKVLCLCFDLVDRIGCGSIIHIMCRVGKALVR